MSQDISDSNVTGHRLGGQGSMFGYGQDFSLTTELKETGTGSVPPPLYTGYQYFFCLWGGGGVIAAGA